MKPSIIDTPDFAGFNDELKEGIRATEAILHEVMAPLWSVFPAELRLAAAPILDQLPTQFLISQLPIYRHVDGLYRTHQRLLAGNPAALTKQ